MARVTEGEVREYQRLCELTEAAAREALTSALGRLDLASEASWPYVLELVARFYSEYGRALAELGRQFYQWCRDVQTDGRNQYRARTVWDDRAHAALAGAVRDRLEGLAEGRGTELEAVAGIANGLGDFAFKAGRDATWRNLDDCNASDYFG